MMLDLQRRGCHNVNMVTPTHYSAHVLRALDVAAGRGLRLPVVYNTCGWERLEVLKLLDGVVDIYLPDFKYWDGKKAAKYSSGAETYPEVTREAVLEMHRQVGVAHPAADGLMYRGLMIRHLVMPNDVGGTKEILAWIAVEPAEGHLRQRHVAVPADLPRLRLPRDRPADHPRGSTTRRSPSPAVSGSPTSTSRAGAAEAASPSENPRESTLTC